MTTTNGNNATSESELEAKNTCSRDPRKAREKDWLVFNIVQRLTSNRKPRLYYVQVNKFSFDIRGKKFPRIISRLRKPKAI